MLKHLAVVAFAIFSIGASCRHKPPKPPEPPQPSEPPKVVQFQSLALSQKDGMLFRNGTQHAVFGFIPCWDGDEINHMGWPGIDAAGMDYALGFGANAFHIRMGPFKKDKDERYPTSLMHGMGPYVNDDSAQGWNEEWWKRVRDIVERAGQKGANVEVDLIDGWGCKHASYGDFEMPWPADDIQACTNRMTPTQEAWLNKVVSELGCYANVIWQDGNEVGVSGRYDLEWSLALAAIVRNAEQGAGCGVRHMLGTNSDFDPTMAAPQFDYTTTHRPFAPSGPRFNKWFAQNEHNPPYTPEQEKAMYCVARNAGQAWWFWRGGMSQASMDKTLGLWAQGCDGFGSGACPFDVPEVAWIKVKPHGQSTDVRLGCSPADPCPFYDATPLATGGPYCRSIGFPPGQSTCPIRQEGDPFRYECEQAALGGQIQWGLDETTGDIGMKVSHQGYQFTVTGHGSARVRCYAPKHPDVDLCKDGQGSELRVSR